MERASGNLERRLEIHLGAERKVAWREDDGGDGRRRAAKNPLVGHIQ